MNKSVTLLLVAVAGFVAGFLTAGIAGCIKDSKCVDLDTDFDDDYDDYEGDDDI